MRNNLGARIIYVSIRYLICKIFCLEPNKYTIYNCRIRLYARIIMYFIEKYCGIFKILYFKE